MTRTRLLGQPERGAREVEREREKLGLQGGRTAEPLRVGTAGTGGAAEGAQQELEGLWRQEYIGAFSVYSAVILKY